EGFPSDNSTPDAIRGNHPSRPTEILRLAAFGSSRRMTEAARLQTAFVSPQRKSEPPLARIPLGLTPRIAAADRPERQQQGALLYCGEVMGFAGPEEEELARAQLLIPLAGAETNVPGEDLKGHRAVRLMGADDVPAGHHDQGCAEAPGFGQGAPRSS